MELPSYNPAIVTNVVSGIAFLVSLASYRLSKKTADAAADAAKPDVHATIAPVPERPGWMFLNLKISNNLPNDLEFSEVKLMWPPRAVGLTQGQASVNGIYGNPELLPEMPVAAAKRTVTVDHMLAPAGTNVGTAPHHPRDTAWIGIYVRVQSGALSRSLRFDAVFSLRKTDVRRFRRIVIPQRIKVPSRQTD